MKLKTSLFLLLAIGVHFVFAQRDFTATYEKESVRTIFSDVERHFGTRILVTDTVLYSIERSGQYEGSLGDVLRKALASTGYFFIEKSENIYILKLGRYSPDFFSFIQGNVTAQDEINEATFVSSEITKYSLSGTVFDSKEQGGIPGVIISTDRNSDRTITDAEGSYSISLPLGANQLTFIRSGYEEVIRSVNMNSDQSQDVEMFDKSLALDEIVISANNLEENVNKIQSSSEVVSIETLKDFPTFLGEVDVINSLTTLPGVTTVGEGSSGFNVRGGNVDENLILLDRIPIFNSSHLFGFFSVFNSDAIGDFTLYKGGIPSNFGGRVSSVLDVRTTNPGKEGVKGSVTGGLISSKFMISTPIEKLNSGIMVSARLAYPNHIIEQFPDERVSQSSANFQDLNVKLDTDITESISNEFSLYASNDEFRFGLDTTYNWSMIGLSNFVTKKLDDDNSVKFGFVASDYNNGIEGRVSGFGYDYSSRISYFELSTEWLRVLPNRDILEVGVQSGLYLLNNGEINPSEANSAINSRSTSKDNGLETAFYVSYDKEFSSRLALQAGLRLSVFNNVGPSRYFNYENPNSPQLSQISDTTLVGNGLYNFRLGVEPRLNVRYKIDENTSLRLGYNLTRQNIHVISVTSAIAPGDYWKLSDPSIPTTIANQVNIGVSKVIGRIGMNVDGYYKTLTDIKDFRDGEEVFLNDNIETALLFENARAYGLEMKLDKRGRLSGWVSYTLSRSERRSEFGTGWIPTNFDKPHNLNVTSEYAFSKRISLSSNLVFASGRPITVPESVYFYDNSLFVNYTERNSNRIPNYQRLDISLIIKDSLRKKTLSGRWAFSVYNLLGRRNPYSIYFDTISGGVIPQGYQLSILGQPFPAISYTLNFTEYEK